MRKISLLISFCAMMLGGMFAQMPYGVIKKFSQADLSPKSIVHSGNGLFFAQNMMYRHSVAVFNREYKRVATISDEVMLSKYGISGYDGTQQGAPVEVAFTENGKYAWVTNYQMFGEGFNHPGEDDCAINGTFDPSFVYKINTENFKIEKVIEVGSVPKFIAASPDGKYVLVSNWCGGDVSVIDTRQNREVRRLAVGRFPRGIAIDRNSTKAYVAVMGSNRIAVIDFCDWLQYAIPQVGSAPRHLCLSPDDRYLYVSLNLADKVLKLDTRTEKVVGEAATGDAPRSMCLADDGRYLFLVNYEDATVSRYATENMRLLQTITVGDKPIGITYDALLHRIWVACYIGSIYILGEGGQPIIADIYPPKPATTPQKTAAATVLPKKTQAKSITAQEKHETSLAVAAKKTQPSAKGQYYIVLGSFTTKENAQKRVDALKKKKIAAKITGKWRVVSTGGYATAAQAQEVLAGIKADGFDGWVSRFPKQP